MSSRREFIRAGTMALGALAAGGSVLRAATASEPSAAAVAAASLYTLVYDDRISDSVAFAGQGQRLGLRTRSLDRGDVTRLWYDDLYHRWKQGPAAIAGLTSADALFVLEGFGNDVGLRLTFKAEHHLQADGVQHRLYGPASVVRAAALQRSGARWNARMAQLVSRCPATLVGRIEALTRSNFSPQAGSERSPLVSWLLAPMRTSMVAI